MEPVATLAGAVADSFEKGADLLEEMAGVRLSGATVERTVEDAGQRLDDIVAAGRTLGPPADWPWHKDYEGKTCAYVELDATGVRQQAPGGSGLEGRLRENFPLVEVILLDFYHPAEKLTGLSRLLHPDSAAEAEEQAREWRHLLKSEGGAVLAAVLSEWEWPRR